MNTPYERNENADGALVIAGDAGCTIHIELCATRDGGELVRLNVTTPWSTWIGVDLTADQLREAAHNMLSFAADEVADA